VSFYKLSHVFTSHLAFEPIKLIDSHRVSFDVV
jgi:hypothetical protein